MTFIITQPCVDTMDQSCVSVCPVDCIHFEEGADRMLYIDPAECIDCGACQPACPVTAIFPEGDVPADQQHFIEINRLWFEDAAAARAKVGGDSTTAAPAVAEAPPAEEKPAAQEPSAPVVEESPAPAPATHAESPGAAPAATPAPASSVIARPGSTTYKIGEAGVEGKCALCGTYVIKNGVRFRTKSVLCPDCAKRQDQAVNPYGAPAGRR